MTTPRHASDTPPACLVCAGDRYEHTPVLWPGLIEEWGLSPAEADATDRQQGTRCVSCRCNLRSIALAGGICDAFGYRGTFDAWLGTQPNARTLEINGAGDLSARLESLDSLVRANYPDVDMNDLPYDTGSFDLVVHSDTIEHVPDPLRGIGECRRVLRPGGWLAMTAPVIPGRMTRSRNDLPPSYHGGAGEERADHLVHTEFGSDIWTLLAEAGFVQIGIRAFAWPSGLCWIARR